jgi:hypothetical protein
VRVAILSFLIIKVFIGESWKFKNVPDAKSVRLWCLSRALKGEKPSMKVFA